MQANILERKNTQRISDTIITAKKKDPAILTVNDQQYTLRIFPMTGYKYRKVKNHI